MCLFKEESADELLEYLNKESPGQLIDNEKRMNWEREYLGLYLTSHPLDNYKNILKMIALTATELSPTHLGKRIKVCGFISKIQQVRTRLENLWFLPFI